eukprot:g8367.t1
MSCSEAEWRAMMEPCPFSKHVENISPDTLDDVEDKLHNYMEESLGVKRQRQATTDTFREHRCYLRRLQGFQLHRHFAEGKKDDPWLDTVAGFFNEGRCSYSQNYVLNWDYSTVRKNHCIYYVEQFGHDEDTGEPWFELCQFPLPIMYALGNPLQKTVSEYERAVFSCLNFLYSVQFVFGQETFINTIRSFSETIDSIDLEVWEEDDWDRNVNKLELTIHGLADQGSPELRLLLLLYVFLPGTWRMPVNHRLSNNLRDLIPQISARAAAIRRFLVGPFHTKENQGRIRNSQRSLKAEAETRPDLSLERPYGKELAHGHPGKSIAEILTDKPTFTHGTDARWLRATEHNDEFDENRLNLTLFQLEPLVQEDADRGNKRKAPAGADADVDVADDGACSDQDRNDNNFDIELDSEDDEATAELGKQWAGHPAELKSALLKPTPEHRQALTDLGRGHKELYRLLNALESHAGDDESMFANEVTLRCAKKYLGEDITSTTALTAPQIQDRLQKRRPLLWKTLLAELNSEVGKSRAHFSRGLHLIPKIINCACVEQWDPSFFMWESWVEDRLDFEVSEEAVRSLVRCSDGDAETFAKRAMKCVVKDKKPLAARAVRNANRSFPLTETGQEKQFQDKKHFRERCPGDESMASFQVKRYHESKKHTRYYPAPAIEETKLTSELDARVLLAPETAEKLGEDPTADQIKQHFEWMRKKELEDHKKSATLYFVHRFCELKSMLQKAAEKDFANLPAKYREIVQYVADPRRTTTTAGLLGFRGVEAKSIMQNKLTPMLKNYHRSVSTIWAGKKMLASRLSEKRGFFVRVAEKQNSVPVWISALNDGKVAGQELAKVGPKKWWFQKIPTDAAIRGGYLDEFDLYDGPCDVDYDGERFSSFSLADGPWISAAYMKKTCFSSSGLETQVALLAPTRVRHPELTETMLRKMEKYCRLRIYVEQMDGNPLAPEIVEGIVSRFGPKKISFFEDGEAMEAAAKAKKAEKRAAKAGLESGPQERPRENDTAAREDGLTRKRAAIVMRIWDLRQNPPVCIAAARSHRVQQGELPDVMRLYWADDYKPKKVHFCPECSSEPDALQNVTSTLLPRVMKEFDLQPGEASVVVEKEVDEVKDFIEGYENIEKPKAEAKSKAAPKSMKKAEAKKQVDLDAPDTIGSTF